MSDHNSNSENDESDIPAPFDLPEDLEDGATTPLAVRRTTADLVQSTPVRSTQPQATPSSTIANAIPSAVGSLFHSAGHHTDAEQQSLLQTQLQLEDPDSVPPTASPPRTPTFVQTGLGAPPGTTHWDKIHLGMNPYHGTRPIGLLAATVRDFVLKNNRLRQGAKNSTRLVRVRPAEGRDDFGQFTKSGGLSETSTLLPFYMDLRIFTRAQWDAMTIQASLKVVLGRSIPLESPPPAGYDYLADLVPPDTTPVPMHPASVFSLSALDRPAASATKPRRAVATPTKKAAQQTMEQLGYFTPQGADTRSPEYTLGNEQDPSTRPQQIQREDSPRHPSTGRAFGMDQAAADDRRRVELEGIDRLFPTAAMPTRATPVDPNRLGAEKPAREESAAASREHHSQSVPPTESIFERRRRRQRSTPAAPNHEEASAHLANAAGCQRVRVGAGPTLAASVYQNPLPPTENRPAGPSTFMAEGRRVIAGMPPAPRPNPDQRDWVDPGRYREFVQHERYRGPGSEDYDNLYDNSPDASTEEETRDSPNDSEDDS